MKIKSIITLAATGLLLASCQDGTNGSTSSPGDIKNATAADSLMYYFGQMRGAEYQRQAERDTVLAADNSRKAFIQGVQAGMNAVKGSDEAYNQGLFLGMQMAMNIQQFKDDYDVTLDKRVFVESLSNAVNADSLADAQEMQREFYRIMGQFNDERERREQEAAGAALTQEAQKLKLGKIADDVYGSVVTSNDSVQLKNGDNVSMEIKLTKADGKEIDAPLPARGKIGARNISAPVNDMLKTMKSGESGRFITSARALFSQRVGQLGLKPADVVIVNIKASLLPQDEENAPKDRPVIRPAR